MFPRIAESSHALIAYRDLAFVAPPAMGFTTLTITFVVLSVAGLGTPCSAAFVAPRAGLGTLIATLHAQARWKVLAPTANPFPAFVAKYHASFALPGRASVATHPGRASVAITIKFGGLSVAGLGTLSIATLFAQARSLDVGAIVANHLLAFFAPLPALFAHKGPPTYVATQLT